MMLEESILAGTAAQLWELPSRLHNNESALREFFARHFEGTTATSIKSIVFGQTAGVKNATTPPSPLGSEAIVEFFDTAGVELVLSRIIQHELLERDEINAMELRRGFVYLGHDRMLVEGIVHLKRLPPQPSEQQETAEHKKPKPSIVHPTASEAKGKGAHTPNESHVLHTMRQEGSDGMNEVSTTGKEETEKMPNAVRVANTTEWNSDASSEKEDDEDDEDEDEEEDEDEGGEDGEGNVLQDPPPQTNETPHEKTVVVCMTFLPLPCHDWSDVGEHNNSSNNNHSNSRHRGGGYDGGNDRNTLITSSSSFLEITPHIVFEMLRGTCFAKKIVVCRGKSSDEENDLDEKERESPRRKISRALVEVDDAEMATTLVSGFNGTIVELMAPAAAHPSAPHSEAVVVSAPVQNGAAAVRPFELEYRFRVRASFTAQRDARRTLAVSANSATALHVRPQGLVAFGPLFSRNWCTPAPRPAVRVAVGGAAAAPPTTRAAQRRRETSRSASRSRRPHRRRRRSSSERHRRRSSSRHRRHRRHSPAQHRRKHRKAERERSRTPASGLTAPYAPLYAHVEMPKPQTPHHYIPQQILQPHMQQEEQIGMVLPTGWRALFSQEYQRQYYVYRDPYTGVETSAWEITPRP